MTDFKKIQTRNGLASISPQSHEYQRLRQMEGLMNKEPEGCRHKGFVEGCASCDNLVKLRRNYFLALKKLGYEGFSEQ